jgi:hypothetical protein
MTCDSRVPNFDPAMDPSGTVRFAPWLWVAVAWIGLAFHGQAAERNLDFSQFEDGPPPAPFRSTVSGEGPPGEWRILHGAEAEDGVLLGRSSVVTRRGVLVQTSTDPTDERFPLLIYEGERYGDFTFRARLRTVSGEVAQMAGIAFRIQDERNYYILRLSSLGNTVAFYKFVDGLRTPPMTAEVEIPTGSWQELAVECRANQIRCLLNGRELFPTLTDSSFLDGYVGFWTKSDARSQFADARVVFTPRETLAEILVREIMDRYRRLEGVKILAPMPPDNQLRVVASSDPAEIGRPGTQVDRDVIDRDAPFFGQDRRIAEVALPLHDRNGHPVATVRVLLRRSFGQTQAGAVSRARPIANHIQGRMQSAGDLTR